MGSVAFSSRTSKLIRKLLADNTFQISSLMVMIHTNISQCIITFTLPENLTKMLSHALAGVSKFEQ